MLLNHLMPRHRPTAVEEAGRWRAFGRYLANIKKYGDLTSAQVLLDKYFSYAVALGVEELALRECANMGARLPLWSLPPSLSPYLSGAPSTEGLQEELAASAAPELPLSIPPSLGKPILLKEPLLRPEGGPQELGELLTRSLQGTETSLSKLLNTAVGDFDQAEQLPSAPFRLVLDGAATTLVLAGRATMSTLEILEEILFTSSGGGGWGLERGGR